MDTEIDPFAWPDNYRMQTTLDNVFSNLGLGNVPQESDGFFKPEGTTSTPITQSYGSEILDTTKKQFDFIDDSQINNFVQTTTDQFVGLIENVTTLIKNATEVTESPVFKNSTSNTSASNNITTDTPIFNLETAINISSVNLPVRAEEETSSISNIKDLLNSMQSTKIMDPIKTSVTHFAETIMPSNITTESSHSLMSSTDNTNIDGIITSTTQEAISTFFLDKNENITSTLTSFVNKITTDEIITGTSELTNEITTTNSTITNEITTVASTITSEITTATSEITNEITTAAGKFIKLAKNVTTTNILRNITSEAQAEAEKTNNWVFYIILIITLLILLLVIGGVYLFYKRVKGKNESGYQVNQMKEYSSSSATDNELANVKV